MKTVQQLQQERAEKVKDLAAQNAKMNAEGYTETPDDEAEFNRIKDEIAGYDKKIERTAAAEKLAAELGTVITPPNQLSGPAPSAALNPALARRTAKLKNFHGPDAELRALRFGHFMLAAMAGNEKSFKWCRDNGVVMQRAANEASNSAGGYLVPDEFSTAIIDLRDSYGMFRRLCQVVPMGRDTLTMLRRAGGLTAYAIGEATAPTQSQMAWDAVRLTANKWGVLTLMSSELDEDAAINIGDLLVGEIAYAFAIAEDTAGFTGDGTSTYHGIRGFLNRFEAVIGAGQLKGAVDAASGHDTFAEIDATDLASLMAQLPQYVYQRGRPAFYCSQVAWALVFQRLIMASGGITKDDATGAVIYRYLGFPVEITPSMPVLTSDLSDKAMILFGDVGMAATFGDRRGMTVARSTEYKFAEDQIAIKATERFDINIHDIGNTTVAGPVVALIGE